MVMRRDIFFHFSFIFSFISAYQRAYIAPQYEQEMLDPSLTDAMTQGLTGGNPYAAYYPYDSVGTIESNARKEATENGISRNVINDNNDNNDNSDDSNQVYGYDRYSYNDKEPNTLETSSLSFGKKKADPKFQRQKVQITAEETGSQRVQVNNGFQEEFVPGLNPESGRVSSGVLLEWRLTFYGSGPEGSQDSEENEDEDEDDSSAVLDL